MHSCIYFLYNCIDATYFKNILSCIVLYINSLKIIFNYFSFVLFCLYRIDYQYVIMKIILQVIVIQYFMKFDFYISILLSLSQQLKQTIMKKTLKQFTQEWNNVTLSKVFEFPVIDKRTNKHEYITFDISIFGRSFLAHHEAINTKQAKSKKIAFVKIAIDTFFSLDYNLSELHDVCINAINESQFFTLAD